MSQANGNLPVSWRNTKLGDVCELNPRRSQLSRHDDAPTTFLPMPAIGEGGVGIVRPEVRPYRELRKGYTSFVEGDVLFAKITPCMQNAKHAIARDLTDGIGFGSTEFHVLRPCDKIISEWIHYFLLEPNLLTDATRYFTGAVGQQRVPDDYLASLEIPLPPLAEQRRITARLREQLSILAKARGALQAQLVAAESLPAAHLRAVFDTTESESWPKKTIGEMIHEGALSEHQDGNHGELHPRNKDFVTEGVKFVTAKHISGDGTVLLRSAPCISKEQASGLRIGFAQANDVLLAHNATVGKVGIAPPECEPFVVGTSLTIYRGNAEMVDPKFLFYTLTASQFQRRLVDAMKQTTRNQVPITKQRTLSLPMPVLDVQHDISAQLDDAFAVSVGLRNSLRAKLSELEKLPAALLRAAFQPSNQG